MLLHSHRRRIRPLLHRNRARASVGEAPQTARERAAGKEGVTSGQNNNNNNTDNNDTTTTIIPQGQPILVVPL